MTPRTLAELLLWYTPPLPVIVYLQDTAKRYGMSPEAAAWLDRVVKVRTGEPIAEMDRFDTPTQPELLEGPATYA